MKTFLVYDLNTGIPVWVGDAIKPDWARFAAAEKEDLPVANLFAEEVNTLDTRTIPKNSRPKPTIRIPAPLRNEALRNEALRNAERYSLFISKLPKSMKTPTFDEWYANWGQFV